MIRWLSIAAALGALGALAVQASKGGLLPALVACALALLPVRIEPSARAIAACAAVLALAASTGALWQAAMGAALLALALGLPWLPWLVPAGERGLLGEVPPLPTLAAGGITPVALVGWLLAAQPDLRDATALVPDLPLPVLLLGAAGFTLVNATLEEVLWRGLFQPHLAALLGPALAIVVQAVSFGAQHAHGVPRGAIGMALAGGWAVLLGALRHRSGGLLAPLLAHFVADATIALMLLWLSQRAGEL